MRHNKSFNHLGRKVGHRRLLLANMTISLIMHKRIKTTVAKAKAVRLYAEPMITKCKTDDTNNRRVVFSYLQDKEAITELFNVVAPKIADRPGGYTRIIKLGIRQGDGTDMAYLELVDFNDVYQKDSAPAAKATRRGRTKKATSQVKLEDIPAVEGASEASEDKNAE